MLDETFCNNLPFWRRRATCIWCLYDWKMYRVITNYGMNVGWLLDLIIQYIQSKWVLDNGNHHLAYHLFRFDWWWKKMSDFVVGPLLLHRTSGAHLQLHPMIYAWGFSILWPCSKLKRLGYISLRFSFNWELNYVVETEPKSKPIKLFNIDIQIESWLLM